MAVNSRFILSSAQKLGHTKSFDIDVVGMQFIPCPIDRIEKRGFDQYQKGLKLPTNFGRSFSIVQMLDITLI